MVFGQSVGRYIFTPMTFPLARLYFLGDGHVESVYDCMMDAAFGVVDALVGKVYHLGILLLLC